MEADRDERTAVKTYVPAYEKDEWAEHADEFDMSLSEFVRSMVQAGRRGFEGGTDASIEVDSEATPVEPPSPGSAPQGRDVETHVLEILRSEPRPADEVVEAVIGDFREEVYDALQSLQDDGRVRHDARSDGYRVVVDE